MKYKVGDIVKVRKDLKEGKDFGSCFVAPAMVDFAGKLVTISSVNTRDCDYHIEEDDGEYYWTSEFFEDEEDCCVDKIIKDEEKQEEEEKSDNEYDYIINKVLREMSEETKDILIKEIIKGENCISIVAVPVYETVCRHNGVSIQRIVGTKKYSVTVTKKDGTVVL